MICGSRAAAVTLSWSYSYKNLNQHEHQPPRFRLCTTMRHVTTILKMRVSGSTGVELSACCCCSSSSSLGEW